LSVRPLFSESFLIIGVMGGEPLLLENIWAQGEEE